ncbi:MAG: HEAT repeat domain-containing protein [Myxococcales bacterium]|nr:HEAT repeat domain-containing protein [Myxococcales bacterium]
MAQSLRAVAVLLFALLGLSAVGLAATERAPAPAEALATSPYPKVRIAAAQTLARRGGDVSRRRLVGLLADPHPLVRLTAAHALRRLGARGPLARLEHDPDAAVRAVARSVR